MMKKIIKSAFLLAVAGAVTVPAFAQEYSSSVSGAVRAEWNMDTISGPKDETGDQRKNKIDNQSIAGGDTYLTYKGTYKNGDAEGSASIRFYANSEKRLTFTGKTKVGDWTGEAKAEWDEYFSSNSQTTNADTSAIDQRDQYVKLSNDMLFFQLGNMQYLNNHFKGGANAFASSFANDTDVGRNNDVRFNSFYGGYKNADLGLDVGVLVSQTSGTGMILPGVTYAPAAADDVTNDDGDDAGNPDAEDFQSTLYGLVLNLKMPDVVGLDVTFEFAQGETKGVKDRDISADGLKGKGTYMALGVGVTPVEGLGIGLNYASSSVSETHRTGAGGAVGSSVKTGEGRADLYLTVDYNFDIHGISLIVGNSTYEKQERETNGEKETRDKAYSYTHTEVGYKTAISGVTLMAGYIAESHDGPTDSAQGPYENLNPVGGTDALGKGASTQRIRLRAEYAF